MQVIVVVTNFAWYDHKISTEDGLIFVLLIYKLKKQNYENTLNFSLIKCHLFTFIRLVAYH